MAEGDKDRGGLVGRIGSTVKGLGKILLQSRRPTIERVATKDDAIIIMGNGPSLKQTIEQRGRELRETATMAVNFAANAPEFRQLRPRFYIMADPVFFEREAHENVERLWQNFNETVDWEMTLLLPTSVRGQDFGLTNGNVNVQYFNPVGVEGVQWFEDWAYSSGLGMPRPRNVLIAAIMVALKLGFGTIYITGADHSWSKTLEVDDNNTVVSVQPHFYADNNAEHQRVASVYKDIALHQIMYSFYVAFRSYYTIRRFARRRGVRIYNATPGSFIDAFERRSIPESTRPESTPSRRAEK